jgi:DNA polymerase IV (DinB-like DNA polymerase)
MRIIGHLDMDAFFASVEERDNPRLAGRPLVIGSDPEEGRGRGVVSTANYKAREYGIRSALPISTAWRLSEAARAKGLPPATFLEVDMRRYGETSRKIMAIVRGHAEHVEEASVDEAYFDLSFAAEKATDEMDAYKKAAEIAHAIKDDIRTRERLTASVGIGPNKLIAKIASDKNKPDGFLVVREEEVESFIAPMAIRKIPGVGPKTEEELKRLGVRTVADAKKKFSEPELYTMFGKWGNELYEKLRGRSESAIVEEWEAKSIGEQETFAHDTRDANIIQERLTALARGVYAHFTKSGFASYGSVTITVRFADFTTKTRSAKLVTPAHDAATLQFEAMRLFAPFFDKRENPARKDIRLIGVRVEKLQ